MRWAVIMAGGSGERFWPKSRKSMPKQLLPITGERTMIQLTIDRLKGLIESEHILIITNSAQVREMKKQLPELRPSNIIAEPVGRDTAACVGLAAILVRKKDPDATMLVMPADHFIEQKEKFQTTLKNCMSYVEKYDCLMTLGIKPDFPATGYGYLHAGKKIDSIFMEVRKFVEKPGLELASKYLESGEYYWNSGMFIWRASKILSEIEKHMPGLYNGLTGGKKLSDILKIYPTLEKKSIDYGIMEHSEGIVLGIADFDWDDIGSWEAIGKHFRADQDGNICIGQARLLDCRDMLVYNLSSDNSLMAGAIGLSNMILVQTDDAVLACPKSSAQDVKKIVEILKKEKLEKFY